MQTITRTDRLLKAPLFAVSEEWEHNGYDDSDFYRTMFDWHTGELRKVETWTTRYGCGHSAVVTDEYAKRNNLTGYIAKDYNPKTQQWDKPIGVRVDLPVTWFVEPKKVPASVWELAERKLAVRIYELIRSAELREILSPDNAKRGDILRLSEPHNSRKTKQVLPTGTKIRVNDCQAFGTFYARGYNHPGRENRSVVGTVLGHPETLVRVPLNKCRLDKEPLTDAELHERANKLAKNRRFEQCWGKVW